MNRQIRHIGYVIIVLFIVLFVQLNNVQVVRADKLANNPQNSRKTVKYFSSPRGVIQTADGVIIARSIPSNDEYKYLRTYPEGPLFAHTTGFFSFTYGSEGIESEYNDELSGKTQTLSQVRDLLRDRTTTNNVTITITKHLQEVARNQLGDNRGAVVALNPKNGDVLAMYSNPSYDPNILASHDFKRVDSDRAGLLKQDGNPMLARAYRESYPPGSTFKVITAAAAYDKQPKLVTKSYPLVNWIELPRSDKTLSNFGGGGCGGKLPSLLQRSCNTSFAQMGMDLGAQNLIDEATAFGFNKRPPLDIPSVATSKIPDSTYFRGREANLAYSAIGQDSVTATPLQMALTASAIANGGTVMAPRLMKEIRNADGQVITTGASKEWTRATTPDTAAAMVENMVGVVNGGSGTAARIPGVNVAGKTGTAQTGGNYIHTWFIAFAPAEDPQIAVAVVVENQPVRDEITGGRIAAPIAREVIKAALGK